MYKAKVWIHKNIDDVINNIGPFWIDITFYDVPCEGDFITVTEDLILDVQDDFLWETEYGMGKYKIYSADKLFQPHIHDGFSYSVMALKI